MVIMAASLKIVRTCLTLWYVSILSVFCIVAPAAYADAVHVKVEDGETSFLVDIEERKIWWITEVCRFEVPVNNDKSDHDNDDSLAIISSDKFLKDVQIGSHRFTLEQQFRFNMVSQAPSLQVYNSVRGGWSEVDIHVDETCDTDFTCRRSMELPLCTE